MKAEMTYELATNMLAQLTMLTEKIEATLGTESEEYRNATDLARSFWVMTLELAP